MSWTKGNIVSAAFEQLALGDEFSLQSKDLEAGLRHLNLMIAEWEADGLLLGYANTPRDDARLNQASDLPDWAVLGVIKNLAIEIAPLFGKQVSAALAKSAAQAYDTISSREIGDDDTEMQMPSHMIKGSGYKDYGYVDDKFFPEPFKGELDIGSGKFLETD